MAEELTPLTPADVVSLGLIVTAVREEHRIRRVRDDVELNGVVRGYVRDEDLTPGVLGMDLRQLYVWVTLRSGRETAWPVRVLMDEVYHRTTVFNPR